MASASHQSSDASSPQSKPKDSRAPMSLNNMLNHTVSQLPTPDVSPNQPAINDLSETPSGTQTVTTPPSSNNSDYLLLSPAPTDSLPPLFPRNRPQSPYQSRPPPGPDPRDLWAEERRRNRQEAHRTSRASQENSPSRRVVSPPHSRGSSQHVSSGQHRSMSATVAPSLPSQGVMPDQWAQITYIGPVNPNDPDGPREAVLQSQAWTNARTYPEQYREMVIRTNHATYASGGAPGLNMLADLGAARLEEVDGASRPRPLATNSRILQLQRRPGQDLSEHPVVSPRPISSRAAASRNAPAQTFSSRPASSRAAASRSTRRRRSVEDAEAPAPKRQRSEPNKKTKYKSYEDIVDYCPDIRTERLKEPFSVEQKANKINLANEPRDLLDRLTKTELDLASNLRLDCNSFLINKRLIFKGKVDHIIKNQTFSKTHAQQWGVIDVNKSSLLFTYFEKAGWMDSQIFSGFVEQEKANRAREKVLEANNETAAQSTTA